MIEALTEGVKAPNGLFIDHASQIYAKTYGIIGLLKMLIQDVIQEAYIRGDRAIEERHLKYVLKHTSVAKSIRDEVQGGESYLELNYSKTLTSKQRKNDDSIDRGNKNRATRRFGLSPEDYSQHDLLRD